MDVTPERRMSSCVITYTAAAAFICVSGFLDTVVTSTFINSSRLSSVRSSDFIAACADTPVQVVVTASANIGGNAARTHDALNDGSQDNHDALNNLKIMLMVRTVHRQRVRP